MAFISRKRDSGYLSDREWLSKKFFDTIFQMVFMGVLASVISAAILQYLL